MKKIHIKDKLQQIGVDPETIIMGDFDRIGEFTAKRERSPNDVNYQRYGAFYRANYERGILVYHLIRQFNLTSFLEIGFGRGYTSFCAAKAFYDLGIEGKIVTIDPMFDERFLSALKTIFPKEWFNCMTMLKGASHNVLPTLAGQKFDFVYIDGDHSYGATKRDWELTRELCEKFVLFDDYHLPTKQDSGTIECSKAIDEINWAENNFNDPELLILDRRMFFDDRRFTDEQIDYGQVLSVKKHIKVTYDELW